MSLLANASTLKTLLVWGSGEEGKCVAGCIAGTQAYCWCRPLQASAYSKWKQAEAQPLLKPGLEQPCFSLRNPACWPVVLEPAWKGRLVNETSTATMRKVLFPSHLRWQTLRPLLVCNFFLGFTQIIWYLSFGKGTRSIHFNTITKSLCNYFCTVVTHQFECIPAFLFTFKAVLIEDVAVAGSIMMLYLSIKWVYFLWFG